MVATKVNAFIATLDPSDENRDLGSFVFEACNALGLSADAELARLMMVSPATFASWKRRGKLPKEQVRWFQTVFPPLVFNRWRSSMPQCPNKSVEYVLSAIHHFYNSKLSDPQYIRDAAFAFGGLLAFVTLFSSTYFDERNDQAVYVSDDLIVGLLIAALEWRSTQEI